MRLLYERTVESTSHFRVRGYNVIEIWGHEFESLKRSDPELRNFLDNHETPDRLNPRDAFFGGRTNAIKLYQEGVMKYVDFTSLYPWTNKYCR